MVIENDGGFEETWQQVQAVTKFLKGKEVGGFPAYGYLDPLKGWGGFAFYFLGSRASAYAKHPDDPAWLFDVDTMKPRVNNAAWVRAMNVAPEATSCAIGLIGRSTAPRGSVFDLRPSGVVGLVWFFVSP